MCIETTSKTCIPSSRVCCFWGEEMPPGSHLTLIRPNGELMFPNLLK